MEDRYKETEEGGKMKGHIGYNRNFMVMSSWFPVLVLYSPFPARNGNPNAGSDCDATLWVRKRFDKENCSPLRAFIYVRYADYCTCSA